MKIEQRIGRLSRIGQTHDVHVFNLVAAGTVEAAVLHLLEAKLNMFELVIGEIDMILGNLDDEREFQDVVADLWAESADSDDFARRIDALGDRLLEAKRAYLEQRRHDDQLFGNRFAPGGLTPDGRSETLRSPPGATSPLGSFLRDYAETTGGLWDEVEPQVYDLMLPAGRTTGAAREPRWCGVAFDPEAIPEHPGAQLASYGTPLVDRLLADAVARGRHAELYLVGLNVAPQGLADRAARALDAARRGRHCRSSGCGVLHFPQAVFWFEATFVSDQKEQELLPVAIDLHHGRQVRHLERLARSEPPGPEPWTPLPEARHPGLEAAYPIARDRVVRTLAALANTRSRELAERLDRQVERMRRYYGDLRAEVEEQAERAAKPRRGRPRQVRRPPRGTRARGAAPHRRAPPEEQPEGPPAPDQPAENPPAQAPAPRDRSSRRPRRQCPRGSPRAGLGPPV